MSGAQNRVELIPREPLVFLPSPMYHSNNYGYNTPFNQIVATPKGSLCVVANKNSENNNPPHPAIYIESGGEILPEIVIDGFVIKKDLFTEIREEINQIKEHIKEIKEIILELQYAPGGEKYKEAESDFKKLIKE